MTTNQKYFGILTLASSIIFFYYLYTALQEQSYSNIWWFAGFFGVFLFVIGFVLGCKDPVHKSRKDLGFQYHLITFLIVNGVGIPWLLFSAQLNPHTYLNAALQVFPWAVGLFFHFYVSSKSIKGMNKEELFD